MRIPNETKIMNQADFSKSLNKSLEKEPIIKSIPDDNSNIFYNSISNKITNDEKNENSENQKEKPQKESSQNQQINHQHQNDYLKVSDLNPNQNNAKIIKDNSRSYSTPPQEIDFLKKPSTFTSGNYTNGETAAETLSLKTFDDNRLNVAPLSIGNSIIFPLLGVTCFISMNAFIASQDCFNHFQPKYHSESFFNNIFFFANTLVQIVLFLFYFIT